MQLLTNTVNPFLAADDELDETSVSVQTILDGVPAFLSPQNVREMTAALRQGQRLAMLARLPTGGRPH